MIDKHQQNEVIIQDCVQKDIFTIVVADKLDHREDSMSGRYTVHILT